MNTQRLCFSIILVTSKSSILILGCGTSTGVPIPGCRCEVCLSKDPRNKRLRTSALIKTADQRNILIDAGPDLRTQALKYDIRRLDAVFFSHSHADHILGIDDLRAFNFVQHEKINCYGTNETLEHIKQCFPYIFNPNPNYKGGMLAQLELNEIDGTSPLTLEGLTIQPFPVIHGGLTVTAFRCGELGYVTDCKIIPDNSFEKLTGVKTLVLDGLRYEEHATHLTIPEAIEIAKQVKAEKTYLTHMTHSVDYKDVMNKLPDGIELAYDGLEIDFFSD